MAKTTAERQTNYRNSRTMVGESGEKRINTWVSTGSHMALSRLANRYGVTKREMLERLITEADQKIEDTLKNDEEWETYHSVTQ